MCEMKTGHSSDGIIGYDTAMPLHLISLCFVCSDY